MKTLKGKRTTEAIKMRGQLIRCPKCTAITTVYHLDWCELMCQFCKECVHKNDWQLVEFKDA